MIKKTKIMVGLSGGVDSSVSAALLLDEGYQVEGCFIKTWQPEWLPCTWKDERRDAMRVCARLGIRYHELDLSYQYKQSVADYMIGEYRAGRTPNPDVMCNRTIKFGGFLDWALAKGCDYVATGHYAEILETDEGDLVLARGADTSKDQSYFLWTLTPRKLEHIVFPVGRHQKREVRAMAEEYRLDTATKKDSQGICFLGEIDMQDFLRHYIDVQPGPVLDQSGQVIGQHEGALLYTLGQRHGFTVTNKGINDVPRYVVAKDTTRNTISVAESIAPVLVSRQIRLVQANIILPQVVRVGATVEAVIRYRAEAQTVRVVAKSIDTLTLEFDIADPTIAPGQSVVLYLGQVCLGGGIVC